MDVSNVQTNVRKTCRTCLRLHKTRKELVPIFDTDKTFPYKNVKFSEMLASISNHAVEERDALPKRVCIICLSQIRSAFFFKSQAENSYKILLGQIKPLQILTIKQEPCLQTSCEKETDSKVPETNPEDMLVEIEPPKLQEHLNVMTNQDEDSLGDIIVYDPEFSSDEDADAEAHDSHNVASTSEGSKVNLVHSLPTDDVSMDSSDYTEAVERQAAESQLKELKELECNICNKQMISLMALKRHRATRHSANFCKYCRRRFGNKTYLKLHIKFKHALKYDEFLLNGQINAVVQVESLPELLDCDNCGSKFCDKESLYRHHSHCDGKCLECSMIIPHKEFYFQHLATEHNIVIEKDAYLECPFGCSKKFFASNILELHVQRSHPEENDKDSIDDTISETEETNSNDSVMQCTLCTSNFWSQRGLSHHLRTMHGAVTAKADQVKAALTNNVPKYTKEEFVDRFMVKKSNEQIRCTACKTDINRRSLNVHLKGRHSSIQPYRCEICPEAFFRSDYRQRHMRYQHIDKYNCIQCSQQFDRLYKYDAHMVFHGIPAKNFKPTEGMDRYDLPATNMKFIEDPTTYDFSATQEPQRRMSTASNTASNGSATEIALQKDEFTKKYFKFFGDNDARCLVCQQDLKLGSIISHLLWKHAIKKPMKCAFCNQRVVKATARLTHMARCHTNEYKCFRCYVQFGKHADWQNHMFECHKEKIATQPSDGEEKDLTLSEVRFVTQPNEEEEIEEHEVDNIEQTAQTPTLTEATYACQYCGRKFTTSRNLHLHMSHKHRENLNETVSKQINSEGMSDSMTFDDFRNNFVEYVENDNIKCLICDKTMKKKNFGNHIKSRHAISGAYKCAVCPRAFFRPEHRMQHMSQDHRGMFFCAQCNIQYYRNSRYAKHMKEMHAIEVESRDEYEVDLMMYELKFVATVTGATDNDYRIEMRESVEVDRDGDSDIGVEEVEEQFEISREENDSAEGMNRDEFVKRYIKVVNKELRRCSACERTMLKRSIYSHLMTAHATTQAFKCPFCDLRLGRAPERMRHIQTFHPDEYKCHECGVQFHKHSLFSEHMFDEHNENSIAEKAEGEEEDLNSSDIKYIAVLSGEDNTLWQDDDSSVTESTNNEASTSTDNKFLKPRIKEEPSTSRPLMHSIFGSEEPFAIESNSSVVEFEYNEFKTKFIRNSDPENFKCIPCGRVILKTSVCAHMRLWHAATMSYNCELCRAGFQRSDYRQRHMKFSHGSDFNCNLCDIQFYRSVLYKQHMLLNHQIKINIPELKTKDEIDPPLESLKFVEQIPDTHRLRKGRKSSYDKYDPIDSQADGLTFEEFHEKYIKESGNTLTCMVCKVTLNKFSLKKHIKLHHATTKPFFCELCSEGFNKVDERMQHMASIHSGHFKCFPCKVQYYMSSSYVEHMQIIHNESISLQTLKKSNEIDVPIERLRFTPKGCNVTPLFKDMNLLVKSKPQTKLSNGSPSDGLYTREQFYETFFKDIVSDGERKTKCMACFKTFSAQNKVFHAYSNHATEKPLKCELCTMHFFFLSKRIKHMGTHHPEDYNCNECSIQFDRAHIYIDHMLKVHEVTVDNISTFADEDIDIPPEKMRYTKEVTSVLVLAKRRRNSLDSPRSADLENSILANYSVKMNNSESLTCGGCQTTFDSSRALRTHLRNLVNGCSTTVANEIEKLQEEKKVVDLNFECDQCDKKCSTQFTLNAHKKFKHEAEARRLEIAKSFGCDQCDKKCSTMPALIMHKKFKHEAEARKVENVKKAEKSRFDVHCDICDFTSFRRDYVEHHVRQVHKPEFHCPVCSRTLSNYFLFLYHMRESHPKAREHRPLHKCEKCEKGFMFEKSLESHMKKHDLDVEVEPDNYCKPCGIICHTAEGFEIHCQNYYHKAVKVFVSNFLNKCELVDVKDEPKEVKALNVEHNSLNDPFEKDPFENMLKKRIEEPVKKRIKLASAEELTSPNLTATPTVIAPSDEDKLDYLKYIIVQVDGLYKCAICKKTKQLRKGMLHHLKQHDEVPSYDCHLCPEKFVFKKKYEKHLECHATNENFGKEQIDVEEHPKFQEGAAVSNVITCEICHVEFKLKIMLNRHKKQWHNDDNPDKSLPMTEQKEKKECTNNQDLPVIKLLKCKHCLEAFIHPSILELHLKERHSSQDIDEPMEDQETAAQENSAGAFACDKCKFVFKELKFLENHQKFFCVFGQARKSPASVVNEQ